LEEQFIIAVGGKLIWNAARDQPPAEEDASSVVNLTAPGHRSGAADSSPA